MDQVVVRIGSDDWARATPCVEWDVRDLLNHLVGSNLRHITLIAGGSERDFWRARAEEQVLGVDPTADWMSSADALDLAFAEPGAMERTVDYRMPTGRALLHGRVFDVTVHTWDLAEALGAECVLDERLVSACLAGPLAEVLGRASACQPPRTTNSSPHRLAHRSHPERQTSSASSGWLGVTSGGKTVHHPAARTSDHPTHSGGSAGPTRPGTARTSRPVTRPARVRRSSLCEGGIRKRRPRAISDRTSSGHSASTGNCAWVSPAVPAALWAPPCSG